MLQNTKSSWKLNFIKWILSVSFAILFFIILAVIFSFFSSLVITLTNYKNWFLLQNSLYLFIIFGLLIFLLMSFSLFVSEKLTIQRIEKFKNTINLNILVLVSIILGLVVLIFSYVSFSFYLSWLYRNFWL
jgi:hypothetical protein